MADSVDKWLEKLGLEKYSEAFTENDIDLDVLRHLTESHLKELGVSLGDRLRLMKALNTLDEAQAPDPAVAVTGDVAARVQTGTGEAERRQLTIMFCDLVGSTALSTQFDPEDLREIIRAYQNVCGDVITQYGGYIAKYMGDGILAYFGYPQAHENDAERAARVGLGIVDAISDIGETFAAGKDLDLAVRVGIDTGLVVVGDIVGKGGAEEASVTGETPNIAARLQALAGPDQVVIGQLTRDLIGEVFTCEDFGRHNLKGIEDAVPVWRVVRERNIGDGEEAERIGGELPLVGRQEELGLLLRSWESSKERHGQVVLIQGEAGIGKSRLLEALRDRVSGERFIWVAIRCSPYHANSALYPIIEHMKRVMGWKLEDEIETRFDKMEAALKGQSLPLEEVVPLFSELMSLPLPEDRYAPLELSAKQKREQTLDVLTGWLIEEAERTPVLQLWEDLHWADPTTLEVLHLYIEQSPTVSMLNVLTYRPEFVPPWAMRSHMTPIALNRMERPEVETLICHLSKGKAVPPEVAEHIAAKADGVPLYVEELTKTILDSDYLNEEADRFTLIGSLGELPVPATLHDSLMERLDRVPRVRELAQLGAVLGREFAYEMLQALAEVEEPSLLDGLGQLVDAELLYQRGRAPRAKYVFKHALIQDAAYESLLRRTRQQHHRQVAALFEERFPDTVAANLELVAHHYTEAGDAERAVHYWQKAGEQARAQSANLEAIAFFRQGIALLSDLDDDEERIRRELSLQISLGHANIVAKGHGADGAETAYARALALCEQLGDVPELAPTLFGLWRFYVVARPLSETNGVATRLLRLAEERQDTELLVPASYALGYTALCMSKLHVAHENLTDGIARYQSSQRSAEIYRMAQDPGVACHAYLAMTNWLLGFPDRAQSEITESIALAEALGDSFSLAYALCFPGAIVSQVCGSGASGVERGLEIANEGGFALWIALGKVQEYYMRFMEQPSEKAFDQLRESVFAVPQMGVHVNASYLMTLFVMACRQAKRIDEGFSVLDEAQQSVDARDERWWEAEIRRLRGELILAGPRADVENAESCFQQALQIARNQEAKSLELRAAMSLARLWRQQDKVADAWQLLNDCYGWFTEGFDTADLKKAEALLDELS